MQMNNSLDTNTSYNGLQTYNISYKTKKNPDQNNEVQAKKW